MIDKSVGRRLALLGVPLGLTWLIACGETTSNVPLPAARVEAVGSADLSGPVGTTLPDPVEVQVFGSDDQPLPGTTVTFNAGNGGSVNPQSATTDEDGIASTRWTLGQTLGPNVLTVTAGSITTTITATATAGRVANIAGVAGDNQTAPAGSAVPTSPSVRLTDAFGNLVANAAVTFTVVSGGGRVTNGLRLTNAQGIATVGSWILGPSAGVQTLAALAQESDVAGNPVLFNATATPPVGSQIVITAGNNQSATVGRLVPIPPTVVVRNASGDGLPGVTVTFEVATGGGAVVGSRQVTDASGTATVGGWFLGNVPGPNTLRAASPGLVPVTFTATAVPPQPVTMAAVSATSQSAPVGTNVPDPPSVLVRDIAGVPVAGVVVTFTVTAGGGTVTGSPATTASNGIAKVTAWKLGPTLGPNTLTATAPGLPSVTFTATGQGAPVAQQPTVRMMDNIGNPVPGAIVTFAVTGGGGSATGANQVTDALGLASVGSWTLASGAPNTLRATVTGSWISGKPVTFTAQSTTQITITTAPAGPISLGTNFTITLQLRNSAGATVALSGVQLNIAIASGGATLNGGLSQTTNAAGSASFTVNVTGAAGARTFTISGAGLSSATTASITFN